MTATNNYDYSKKYHLCERSTNSFLDTLGTGNREIQALKSGTGFRPRFPNRKEGSGKSFWFLCVHEKS